MNDARPVSMPKARSVQLIIKELPDETLVYDLASDKAHCLNQTAALVWKICDGKNNVGEIASSVGDETHAAVDEHIVWLALDELEKFDLLETAPVKPTHLAGVNRRQLIKNVGLAALAIPVIMSISVPTPAQTASICAAAPPNAKPNGCPCGGNGNCLSNNCSGGICVP